jgi:hypothetical protein
MEQEALEILRGREIRRVMTMCRRMSREYACNPQQLVPNIQSEEVQNQNQSCKAKCGQRQRSKWVPISATKTATTTTTQNLRRRRETLHFRLEGMPPPGES